MVYHLVGLVVEASSLRAEDPGSIPAFSVGRGGGGGSMSSHTSDSYIGTPVASLPGAGSYRVSAGDGWPGVSIL